MNNSTIMDINGSKDVEVSVRMKLSKDTYKVLNNSLKYYKFQYGFGYTYMYNDQWQKLKSAF